MESGSSSNATLATLTSSSSSSVFVTSTTATMTSTTFAIGGDGRSFAPTAPEPSPAVTFPTPLLNPIPPGPIAEPTTRSSSSTGEQQLSSTFQKGPPTTTLSSPISTATPPSISVTHLPTASAPTDSIPPQAPSLSTLAVASSSPDLAPSHSSFTQSTAIASSSTPPSSTALAGLTTDAGSSSRSSNNIASIAAPAAVGAVLVPIIALFFWWWKRRSSFGNAYNRRNRSNDTEMSNLGGYAQGPSLEPKKASDEQGNDGAGTVTFTRSRTPEQGEIKAWPVEPTFAAGILPGLASRSPTGTSFASPPPYFKGEGRSDSPTHYLVDSIEPRAVTSSEKVEEPARRPISAHRQSSSKRHSSVRGADMDWPLPSPFRDLNSKAEVQGTPPVLIVEGVRPGSSKKQSSEPMPPPMTNPDHREGGSGPTSPSPVLSRPTRRPSPKPSIRSSSRQSPFGDEHADDSESEYSVSVRDKRPRSSMLSVPEGKQINDDGISEMSVSSNRSDRKSHLNHRASDEISVVSSLNDIDDVVGPHEAGTGRRRSLVTALPDVDNL